MQLYRTGDQVAAKVMEEMRHVKKGTKIKTNRNALVAMVVKTFTH